MHTTVRDLPPPTPPPLLVKEQQGENGSVILCSGPPVLSPQTMETQEVTQVSSTEERPATGPGQESFPPLPPPSQPPPFRHFGPPLNGATLFHVPTPQLPPFPPPQRTFFKNCDPEAQQALRHMVSRVGSTPPLIDPQTFLTEIRAEDLCKTQADQITSRDLTAVTRLFALNLREQADRVAGLEQRMNDALQALQQVLREAANLNTQVQQIQQEVNETARDIANRHQSAHEAIHRLHDLHVQRRLGGMNQRSDPFLAIYFLTREFRADILPGAVFQAAEAWLTALVEPLAEKCNHLLKKNPHAQEGAGAPGGAQAPPSTERTRTSKRVRARQ